MYKYKFFKELKMRNFFISLPITLLIFASCASAPTVEITPFDTSKTYMEDFDTQWSKLVRFFSTNQVGIGTIEKDSGIITLNGENLSYGLIQEYCPNAASLVPVFWSPMGGNVRGNVSLVDEGDFTTANVNVRLEVKSQYCYNGCQYSTKPCDSGGAFEKAVLDSLD